MYAHASRALRTKTGIFALRGVQTRVSARGLATLPSFSLEGKTCVVTGAGRGLGKECLTGFALSGARGACIDLTLPASQASIAHITEHMARATPALGTPDLKPYACDVTSEMGVRETFARIASDFGGRIDVLVTAAGIVDNVAAEGYALPRWKKMIDVNLNGTWLAAKEAGRYMLEAGGGGSIILVGSMSGQICVRPQKQAGYNASKAAVNMLAKSLATEWAPHGIRVNSLSPGYIATDLIKGLLAKEGTDLDQSWVQDIPMGRMAHPSEFQGTAVWMASDASSYLTGSDIVVDGGYTAF